MRPDGIWDAYSSNSFEAHPLPKTRDHLTQHSYLASSKLDGIGRKMVPEIVRDL